MCVVSNDMFYTSLIIATCICIAILLWLIYFTLTKTVVVKSYTSHLELSEMFGWSAWVLELDEGARSVKEVELESTDMADIGSTVSLDAAGRN